MGLTFFTTKNLQYLKLPERLLLFLNFQSLDSIKNRLNVYKSRVNLIQCVINNPTVEQIVSRSKGRVHSLSCQKQKAVSFVRQP